MSCVSFFEFSDSYLFFLQDGIIEDVNGKFLSHFGYEKSKVLGMKLDSLILTKDLSDFQLGFSNRSKVVAQVLSQDSVASRVEWEFQDSEHGLLVKGNDITEKLKHEQRFEQYSLLLRGVNESLEKSSHRLYLLQTVLSNSSAYSSKSISKIIGITTQTHGFDSIVVTKRISKGRNLVSNIVGETNVKEGAVISDLNTFSQKLYTKGNELLMSLKNHQISQEEDYLKGAAAIIGYPLKFDENIVGTVEFISNNSRTISSFDNTDLQFLRLIADVIGRLVELQNIKSDLEINSQKLEDKNEELDEFAHVISHDLKAPLRAIKNLIGFIREDNEESVFSADSKSDFELIERRADRMSSLIDGVLEYSRVGREETPTTEFELKEIVTEVTDQLRPMNEKVKFDVNDSFPRVKNKELFMCQMVSNLVSNAIKYNDKEIPEIRITSHVNENICEVWVEDNGPGIPERSREKIFGVFETLERRDDVESTGIGLTIVKKMAMQMGGDSFVTDSSLGGAKFVCSFNVQYC